MAPSSTATTSVHPGEATSEPEIRQLLARGEVQFVIHIPEGFSREPPARQPARHPRGSRRHRPGSDGQCAGRASANSWRRLCDDDLTGPLARLRTSPGPVDVRLHRHYNPEGITQYNVVPGLLGVVLTMTMVIITAVAITRERERGTMENLLATAGAPRGGACWANSIPYILVGYLQTGVILLAARLDFRCPDGRAPSPCCCSRSFVFIGANLAVGITFSTIAHNQLQAMQMAFFFFLPSMLLSGFMFPFRGMPGWAQVFGEILPLTHFLRVVRGILLKGNGIAEILPDLWPIALFGVLALAIA
jgi:ABC-2 type transport system permease protein